MRCNMPKHITIIGVGNVGSGIAYSLLLLKKGWHIALYEPHEPSQERAKAEYFDLLPVAKARGNELTFHHALPKKTDAYVLTAGLPRKSVTQDKAALYDTNVSIVATIAKDIPEKTRIFVVTNPPKELAKFLMDKGYDAHPLRDCTDALRAKAGNAQFINNIVLSGKGYTSFTPGYAIAMEVVKNTE
jgi:malate/lactate dehydrogenase